MQSLPCRQLQPRTRSQGTSSLAEATQRTNDALRDPRRKASENACAGPLHNFPPDLARWPDKQRTGMSQTTAIEAIFKRSESPQYHHQALQRLRSRDVGVFLVGTACRSRRRLSASIADPDVPKPFQTNSSKLSDSDWTGTPLHHEPIAESLGAQ